MKYIYLFEDRQSRMNQLLPEIDNYPLLRHSIFQCPANKKLSDYIKENYSDAAAFLMHKSYQFGNDSFTIDLVKNEVVSTFNNPFVIFSGGLNNNIYEEKGIIMADINSGELYKNLPLFHDTYYQSQKINIPLLVYGKNYLKHILLGIQYTINTKLISYDKKAILDYDIKDEIHDEIREIIGTDFDSEIKENIRTIDEMLGNSYNNLTAETLLHKLQSIINRY